MDCLKDQFLKARTYQEASRILETVKAKPSMFKLTEIAFANPQSREVLLAPVVKEMDDHVTGNQAKGKENPGEHDIENRIKEENITTPHDSEGSSDSTEPYPKEGTDAPNSDIESMQTASGEDQMKEGLPGQMPGMPPMQQMGGMPPVNPALMGQMQPQLPPGLNPAMMKQMQYTVDLNTKPILSRMGKIEEAINKLSTALKETQGSKATSMELKIPTGQSSWFKSSVKETTPDILNYAREQQAKSPASIQLDQKRNEISNLDKNLSRSPYA